MRQCGFAGVRRLTIRQSIQLITRNIHRRLRLAEKRHNRLTRMSTNNRDRRLRRVLLARDLRHERLRAHDVERGDAEQLRWVEDARVLEDFGRDGHRAVDGVGDDEEVGFGAEFGGAFDEVADDAGVDLEEVIAGHAGLAWVDGVLDGSVLWENGGEGLTWDTGWDDNHIGAGEGLLHASILGQVTRDFLSTTS